MTGSPSPLIVTTSSDDDQLRSYFEERFVVYVRCFLLFAAVIARCFSLLFGTTVGKKAGFLRLRTVVPLLFFGIISDISERRHHKRSPLRPVVACFPDLEAKNLNNLLLITFHSCTRRTGAPFTKVAVLGLLGIRRVPRGLREGGGSPVFFL